MKIINPATEAVIQELDEDTAQSIREKYVMAREGQKSWSSVPLEERIRCIERFSALLDSQKERLCQVLTAEMGKPLSQSGNEINGARNRIGFFTENSAKWLSEEWMITEGGTKEKITYEPLGVIANISAWNYPYLVGVNVFIQP
jgi:acyl-CoA reductase-like NAD-dependent aldehyde dehydrogenase